MGGIKKFTLLLWKNMVLQKRHPLGTAFQILLPVILSLVLVIVRQKANTIIYNGETHFPRFGFGECKLQPMAQNSSDELLFMTKKIFLRKDRDPEIRISFAPINDVTEELMVTTASLFLQPIKSKL